MPQSRKQIERAILHCVLLCNGYSQIADILKPSNFHYSPHKEIMETMTNMYPIKPIDLITLTHELKHAYPDNSVTTFELLAAHTIASTAHLRYWAIILLQIDIQVKFRNKLLEWYTERQQNFHLVEAAAIEEIIQTIRAKIDMFEMIEKCLVYFQHMKMEVEYEGTSTFYENLNIKCNDIRKMNSLNNILQQLYYLTDPNPDIKAHCQRLIDAVSDMILTGSIKTKYYQAVQILENN